MSLVYDSVIQTGLTGFQVVRIVSLVEHTTVNIAAGRLVVYSHTLE